MTLERMNKSQRLEHLSITKKNLNTPCYIDTKAIHMDQETRTTSLLRYVLYTHCFFFGMMPQDHGESCKENCVTNKIIRWIMQQLVLQPLLHSCKSMKEFSL